MRIGILLLVFSFLLLGPAAAQEAEIREQIEQYYNQRNRLAAITTLDERLTLASAEFDSTTASPRLREALLLIDQIRRREVGVDEEMVLSPRSHPPCVQPALMQVISVTPISPEQLEVTVRTLPLSRKQNLQLIAQYENPDKQIKQPDISEYLPESLSVFRWTFDGRQWKVNPTHITLLSE
jgi:hypothetical protein